MYIYKWRKVCDEKEEAVQGIHMYCHIIMLCISISLALYHQSTLAHLSIHKRYLLWHRNKQKSDSIYNTYISIITYIYVVTLSIEMENVSLVCVHFHSGENCLKWKKFSVTFIRIRDTDYHNIIVVYITNIWRFIYMVWYIVHAYQLYWYMTFISNADINMCIVHVHMQCIDTLNDVLF